MGWGAAFFTSATAVCFAVLAIPFVCGSLWAVLGWKRRPPRVDNPALQTLRIVVGGGCLILFLCFGWLSFTYTTFNYNLAHAASIRFSVEPAGSAPVAAEPKAPQSAR